MANDLIKTQFKAIADAIREKTGITGKLTANEMPEAIANIAAEATPAESNIFIVTADDYKEGVLCAESPFVEAYGEGMAYKAAIIPSEAFIAAYNVGKTLRFATVLGQEYLEDSYFSKAANDKNSSGGAYFNNDRTLLKYPDVGATPTDFIRYGTNQDSYYFGLAIFGADSINPMKLAILQDDWGDSYVELTIANDLLYPDFGGTNPGGGDGGIK